MTKTKLPYTIYGGYRRFCSYWWRDLWRWLTMYWWRDLYWAWHRARYGWSPKDVWSADHYLAKVMGEMLAELAEHSSGAPYGYPCTNHLSSNATDFEQWASDLRRWSEALLNYTHDNYVELYGSRTNHGKPDYIAWHADERARSQALHETLKEIEPWFEALWD